MLQCVRFIYAYMGFAGFSIFFFLTGIISLQLIEKAQLRLDAFSFLYFLYNFAVRLTTSTAFSHIRPCFHLPACGSRSQQHSAWSSCAVRMLSFGSVRA